MSEREQALQMLKQERDELRQRMGQHLIDCPDCTRIGAEKCGTVKRWIEYHRLLDEQMLALAAPSQATGGELRIETEADGRIAIRGDRAGYAALFHSLRGLLINPDIMSTGVYRDGAPWFSLYWLNEVEHA